MRHSILCSAAIHFLFFIFILLPSIGGADTITINYDPPFAYVIGFGHVGSFNIGTAIPDRSIIQSAYVTYFFSDDNDSDFYSKQITEYAFTGTYAQYGNEIWERNVTYNYYDAPETVLARTGGKIDLSTDPWTWIGGGLASTSTSYYEKLEFTKKIWDSSSQNPVTGAIIDLYSNEYSSYTGYNGLFQIKYYLDSIGLTEFKNDGLLNFVIGTTDGDVNFLLSELTIETSSTAVPLPPSSLLFGTGLIGCFGYIRWKLKRS